MSHGPASASGDESPSSWSHRGPALVLALAGAAIAGYLTLYQAGVLASVWEPLFGNGSERVLTSAVARLLPVPDAALGLVAYLVEAALIAIGGEDRWRRRPQVVLAMGVVVALMGIGAIGLVALQAAWLGAFCTLCLSSAAISLVLVALAAPEVLAVAGDDRHAALTH